MLTLAVLYWLFVVWLVALGSAVGSFLNVVVYRLPLGISLVYPPSRCPKCGNGIAWYDNVPVLGWIMLRGRCRQCHNPISARYPIIEALTAAMFGVVAIAEMPYMSAVGFYGLYPYHLLLLCTLLCAALIEYDGNRVPWRLFVPALVMGVAAPMIWPELAEWMVPKQPPLTVLVLLHIGVTAWIGIAFWVSRGWSPTGPVVGFICAILFLGLPAAAVLATGATGLYLLFWLLGRFWPRMRIPPSMIFGVFALLWVLAPQWMLWAARLASS
jgi:leader peptidase (prepilin peptidase)/N-methyltransferase